MDIAITKDQLKALQERRGQLDEDSGQVFVKPICALNENDGLYYGHVELRDLQDGEKLEQFSLSKTVATTVEET